MPLDTTTNPSPGMGKRGPGDVTNQVTNPQKTLTDKGNPADAAKSQFAIDDVTPSKDAGAGSPGAMGKSFRV